MGKLSKVMCTKLNMMRLISISIVMVVMMMLCFAVQIKPEKKDGEKKKVDSKKVTAYDHNLTVDYGIICDAETGKLYITTHDTDLTKEVAEDNSLNSDTYYHKDIQSTSYYTPIRNVVTEARNYLDANGNLSSSYTKLAELPADLAKAITIEKEDGKVAKIAVNSLRFSTNFAKSMVMPTDCGNYDCHRSCNFCKNESALVDGGTSRGDSDGRNGVRVGCALYIYGNAELELEGDSLFEINDSGIYSSGKLVANSGDVEAGYGIYCDGVLTVLDDDNDGSMAVEFDSLYYYDTEANGAGKTYANYDCGVFCRNGINIEGNINILTTRDAYSGNNDNQHPFKTRGYNGIAVQNGNITINKGKVNVTNKVMVAAADSSKSYKAFAANPDRAVPADSFGFYKGLVIFEQGNIILNGTSDNIPTVEIENFRKVETLYGLITYHGDVINNRGKIYINNDEAVMSYIYIDINALTNGKYSWLLGNNAVLDGYETLGGIYGIYTVNASNQVVMNKGEYIFDSIIEKENGVEKAFDNGQSKYIWDLYGIFSEGEVEIDDSIIDISGYALSSSVGIYSKKNQELKNSAIALHMRAFDTNWEKPGIVETLEGSFLKGAIKSLLKLDGDTTMQTDYDKFYYRTDGIFLDNIDSSYSVNISNCNLDIDVACKRVYIYTNSGVMHRFYTEEAVASEKVINALTVNLNQDGYKNILTDATWDKAVYSTTNPSGTTINNVVHHTADNSDDPSVSYVPNRYDIDSNANDIDVIDMATINDASVPSSTEVYNWGRYTCIKIKAFAEFYFRYNGDTNEMYYVLNDNPTKLSNNEMENGWSISSDGLVLEDFSFDVSNEKALEVIGNANIILKGNNEIKAKIYQFDNGSNGIDQIDYTHYGIDVANGSSLTIKGDGKLSISKESVNGSTSNKNNFVAIKSLGTVTLGPATYDLKGESYGIESTGVVALAGCNMTVTGSTKAISAPTVTTDESYYETIVKNATVSSATVTNKKVSEITWASCTAATTAGQTNYYLRYDATVPKMSKVSSDGTKVTDLSIDEVSGWRIENGMLVLEDFEFSTAADICLEIVGDANVYVDYSATNENGNDPYYLGAIVPFFDASTRTFYGIKVKGNLEIASSDVLNINRVDNGVTTPSNTGTFVSIGIDEDNYNGDLTIKGGTYNLTSTIGIDYITEGGRTSVDNASFAVNASSYAMRYLTGTNIEPVELKCGTSANFTLKGSKVSNTDNFRLHQTGEYRTVVASATEGATADDYPTPCDFTTCSYVKLGAWVNYYFVFDGTSLCRAWKDDDGKEVSSVPYTTEQMSNMGAEISSNVLVLRTFKFDSTMADICLKVVGENTGIKLYGNNVLKSRVYKRSALDSADLTKYGIVIESDKHTFDASSSGGTLTVAKASFMDRGGVDSDNDFIAVDVSPKTSDKVPTVKFNKGIFTFNGEEAAINVNTTAKITVNKNTVTLIGDKYGIKNGGELTIDIDEDATANIDITAPTSISTNNVILDDAGYFKTAITEAVQSGQTLTYPIAYDFTTYTSAKIGGVAAYYYRLNSDDEDKKLLMCARGGSASKEVKMDGLSVEEATTEDGRKYNVLVMENFNFETCADEAIQLAGRDNRPTKLVVKGENNINALVYYNYPSSESNPQGSKDYTSIGVRLRSTDHIFEERIDDNGVGGTLNITKRQLGNKAELVTNGTFRSISSTYYSDSSTRKSLEMKSGTYNLYGEGQAIYNEHTDVVISGGTYTIEKVANANEAIKAVNKDVKFLGGTINVSAESGRAVYAKNNCIIDGATLNVSNSNIGVYTSSGSFTMNSGSLDISNSSTAMSIKNGCTITGGQIDIDGASQGISLTSGDLTYKDGTLNIDIEHNAVNVQAGGLYMTGGTITCTRAEYALTSTTESVIAGGIVNLSNVGIGILVKDGFLDINSSTVDINATNNGIHFNAPNTSYVTDSIVNVTASGNALHYADTSEMSNLVCDKKAVMNLNATSKVANANVALQQTTDYKTAVIEATESGVTKNYPSPYDLTKYTYAQIGTVNQFYLQFDGQKFYKVGTGTAARSGVPIDGSEIEGEWSYADGVLTLNNFNFATTSERCVTIVGNGLTVKLEGENNFTSNVYYNGVTDTTDAAQFGLVTTGTEITFTGDGTLNISKEKLGDSETMTTSGGYVGIVTDNSNDTDTFNVAGGTLNVQGELRGIQVVRGDLNVSGGEFNVSTSNARSADAHIIDILTGDMTVTGGKVTTSTTMSAPIGLVFQGDTSKLTVTGGECIFRGPGQGGIVFTKEGGTLDIQVAVQGSRYYDGTELESIDDINNTFRTSYSSYEYFRIMPPIMSVTIAWGDLAYTGTETWDDVGLKYNCTFTTADGGDVIDVINEGNMPVVARVKYTTTPFTYKSFTHDLNGGISANLIPEEDDIKAYKIGIGKQLNSKLVIDPISYTGYSLNNTDHKIGDVTITLLDN